MNRLYLKTLSGFVKVITTLCWRNLKTAFATIFLAQVSFDLRNINTVMTYEGSPVVSSSCILQK